jgi:hypothetical protein
MPPSPDDLRTTDLARAETFFIRQNFVTKWAVKWRQLLFLWLGGQPIGRSTGEGYENRPREVVQRPERLWFYQAS